MEFAYSPAMQGILIAVSTAVTVLINYLYLNLALLLNGESISTKRKVLFIVVFSAFQQAFIYGFYLSGVLERMPPALQTLVTMPGPVQTLVFYFLFVKIGRLSKYRSLHVVNEICIYGILMVLFTHVVAMALFPQKEAAYNYLTDTLRSLAALGINLAAYFAIRAFLHRSKNKFVMRLTETVTVNNYGKLLAWSIVGYCVVFFFAAFVPAVDGEKLLVDSLCAVVLFLLLACYLFMMVDISRGISLKNKDAYIYSLSQSADELRAVKHDMNAVLSGYGGYIDIGNLEKLSAYHKKVLKMADHASAPGNLAQRVDECPALVSLLIAKLSYAEEKGADLQYGLSDALSTGVMNEVDACRCISILLDNAIEAAVDSEDKRARLSYQVKNNGNRLFVVTNSTKGGAAPQPGISTKEGHAGLGLKTVRKVLGRCPGCTYNMAWYLNECTAYLEIPEEKQE